jgi:hypothetical protein
MTPRQLAGRLRTLAGDRPSQIYQRLHELAAEVEQDAELDRELREQHERRQPAGPHAEQDADIEAIVRATQEPPVRPAWWRRQR